MWCNESTKVEAFIFFLLFLIQSHEGTNKYRIIVENTENAMKPAL